MWVVDEDIVMRMQQTCDELGQELCEKTKDVSTEQVIPAPCVTVYHMQLCITLTYVEYAEHCCQCGSFMVSWYAVIARFRADPRIVHVFRNAVYY